MSLVSLSKYAVVLLYYDFFSLLASQLSPTIALFYHVAYGPEKETWDILIKNSNKQSRYVRYAQNRFRYI